MSEEFHLHFGDERAAARAADALGAATIGGRPGFSVVRNGTDVLTGCAILDDDTLWCWGANSAGQVGDGTTVGRHTPVAHS